VSPELSLFYALDAPIISIYEGQFHASTFDRPAVVAVAGRLHCERAIV
jgi:hypothetical protein